MRSLVGEPATANLFVLGMALQAGSLPISVGSILQSIDLNGVAVEANRLAFEWGRCAVADPEQFDRAIEATAATADGNVGPQLRPPLDRYLEEIEALGAGRTLLDAIGLRAADLVGYQDERLAEDYLVELRLVARREREVVPGSWRLTDATAQQLYRVLAYKDEYEVARLLTDPATLEEARSVVDGPAKLAWNLHPPTLRGRGLDHKIEIGTWAAPAMRFLARRKGLRGTRLDPFRYAKVRRAERRLIRTYRRALSGAVESLSPANYELAVEIACLPDLVRGYEDRKLAGIAALESRLAELESARMALPAI